MATPLYISFSAEIIQNTTETLLSTFGGAIEKGFNEIHLMLSTTGGNVANGITIFNALSALPIKLVTYNVGNIESIGNVIFLAGEERYTSRYATFSFHGVYFPADGQALEEKFLRERLLAIERENARTAGIIASRTKATAEKVQQWFRDAVTLDPDAAKAEGIVQDIREVKVPDGTPFFQLGFQR